MEGCYSGWRAWKGGIVGGGRGRVVIRGGVGGRVV